MCKLGDSNSPTLNKLTGDLQRTLDGHIMVVALESLKENAVNLFHSGILFIFSMKKKFINGILAFKLLLFT